MKLKRGEKVLIRARIWPLLRRKVRRIYENFLGEKFALIGWTLYKSDYLKNRVFTEVDELEINKDVDKGIPTIDNKE